MDRPDDFLTRQVDSFAAREIESEFRKILKDREQVLSALFEVGLTPRIRLDQTQPINRQAELVRKEMEDLAASLEAQLPSLEKRYKKVHSKLKGLASRCNRLTAMHDKKEIWVKGWPEPRS